jgi:microsomal dipeptidase-like Zn-dependent dipeptidase
MMKRLAILGTLALWAPMVSAQVRPPPIPPPRPPANLPPWNFDTAGDTWGWTRTGSFAGEAIYRCPEWAPRTSQNLPVAASARALGGDYWNVPLLPDGHGCWIESAGAGRGTATTPEIPAVRRYLTFRIGGGNLNKVELQVPVGAGWLKVGEWAGEQSGMRQVTVDLDEIIQGAVGRKFRLLLKDDSDTLGLAFDSVSLSATPPGPAAPSALWGFVDLHTHPFNQMGFGGRLLAGSIHPSIRSVPICSGIPPGGLGISVRCNVLDEGWRSSGRQPAEIATKACYENHGRSPTGGGTMSYLALEGGHHGSGFPEYEGWPHHTTKVHQIMYFEWLKRARDGGLRVMHADVGHSHLMAMAMDFQLWLTGDKTPNPDNDDWNIAAQVQAAHEFVRLPEVRDWAEIARTPADLRRIVGAGKLAIVLGVELEDFGDFVAKLKGVTPETARTEIRRYLTDLHAMGVRHIFPIHLTNNAFGGTALYNILFVAGNLIERKEMIRPRNAFANGIRWRMDTALVKFDADPGWQILRDNLPPLRQMMNAAKEFLLVNESPLGHANSLGLTPMGEILIDELMRLGYVIDVDHMSDLAVDRTLTIAEANSYPVIASHTAFRSLMHGTSKIVRSGNTQTIVANRDTSYSADPLTFNGVGDGASERARSDVQLERIRNLGGMVGLGTGPATTPFPFVPVGQAAARVANDCDGTTKSYAQYYLHMVEKMQGRGVAIGTDADGLADLLGPRFGPAACPGADPFRNPATQVASQQAARNGVRYTDRRLVNLGRWLLGKGAYTGEETIVWAAIEEMEAGQGIDPGPNLDPLDPGAVRQKVGRMAHAFHRAQVGLPLLVDDPLNNREDTRIAQRMVMDVLAGRPTTEPAGVPLRRIWDLYHAIASTEHPALVRSKGGTTDFDYNIDGLAHYGLLPDMLQDLRNVGLKPEDLAPLFHGAEYYARMWEKIEQQAAIVRARP